MTHIRFCIILIQTLIILLFATKVVAQPSGDSAGFSQVGGFIGRVLPNGIDGADEIFEKYGLRYSIAGGKSSYYDITGFYADSEGVQWTGVSFGISAQIPIETLIGHAGVGLDYTRVETETAPADDAIGGHFIGGVMTSIDGGVLVRFDMKFNSGPGTSLFFALGIVFELGGGASQ